MKNKKLMISLFSLCLVAIVGLLATVIVFAATSQNITSSITISYTADQVSGSLTAKYTIGTTDTTIGTKSFSADSTAGNLTGASPTLTAASREVLFTYTFVNKGANTATLKLTGSVADSNLTITYSNDNKTFSTTLPSVDVAGGASGSVYVKMRITDTAKNVGLNSSYNVVISNKG